MTIIIIKYVTWIRKKNNNRNSATILFDSFLNNKSFDKISKLTANKARGRERNNFCYKI